LGPVVAVAAGASHTAAIKADGPRVCFGSDVGGQCGVPADLGPVVAVAAGEWLTAAIKADGTLVCFGYDDRGQCRVPADLGPVIAGSARLQTRANFSVAADGVAGQTEFAQGSIISAAEVIEAIEHNEPPAMLSPAEAENVATARWAGFIELLAPTAVTTEREWADADAVERRIQTRPRSSEEEQSTQPSNAVHVVSFRSGQGHLFRKMLLEDKEFRKLLESLAKAGFKYELPSGTIVLVRPDQYLETRAALRAEYPKGALKRYNVVIAASEEYLMDEVLLRMASKKRPRENRAERQELGFLNLLASAKIDRTFLHIASSPPLRNRTSVNQSTTEAVRSASSSNPGYLAHYTHNRGQNPRRIKCNGKSND